jgi:hypothetical protein
VLDVELGVSDLGLRVVDRGLSHVAFVGPLVDTLGGRELVELQLCARLLTGGGGRDDAAFSCAFA